MTTRSWLFPLASALVVALGACALNTAGLPASSDGIGGATSVTSGASPAGTGGSFAVTSAAGGGEAAQTGATAQSSAGSSTTSAASTSASSSSAASSSASSSSAASSSVSSSASSSSGGGTTCDGQYGMAKNYLPCASSMGSCEFSVKFASDKSCRQVCSGFGGECEATFDNGNSNCTYTKTNKGCDYTMYMSAVCRCSLGCGGGPPCPSGKTCMAGVCKP